MTPKDVFSIVSESTNEVDISVAESAERQWDLDEPPSSGAVERRKATTLCGASLQRALVQVCVRVVRALIQVCVSLIRALVQVCVRVVRALIQVCVR